MNAPVTFNTLAFVRKLEVSGMEPRQAQALAEALSDAMLEMVATKADVTDLGRDLRQELRGLEPRLKADLRALERRLMPKLGAAIAASSALTVAISGALVSQH